jgi:hypothetical protein
MLAGCGASVSKTVIHKTVTEGASTTASSSTTQPTSTTTTTQAVHLTSFQSPSHNIGCVIAAGTARCDIRSRTWSPPPRPASCSSQVDFGQGLEVGKAAASFVCAGDTTLNPSAKVLDYGTATQSGTFSCLSETSGITCKNADTGHGFFLSQQSYRLF